MHHRIHFVPWPRTVAGELAQDCDDWIIWYQGERKDQRLKAKKNLNNYPACHVVCYERNSSDKILSNTKSKKSVIYVHGHGLAESTEISITPGNAKKLDYGQVAKRLIDMGLQKDFEGKIKFYNCESAGDDDESVQATSFAFNCAAELYREHRVTKCTFYGYTASIRGIYELKPEEEYDVDEKKVEHRWAFLRLEDGNDGYFLGRASEYRLKIDKNKF